MRKPMKVCQNCECSNNEKGKFIHTWKRRRINNQGFWHIFCEKRNKYYPWDYRKRCFKRGYWLNKKA